MASALNSIGRDGAVDATIRNEIIPRLMLAFRELAARPDDDDRPDITDFDAEYVARMALDGDEDAAAARLDALAAQGVGLDRLFLDVLAPAARRIGA
ncbi:MAG: coenzyme B12-binding protein, partial [Pseudomonadota bacterium]